MKALTSSKKDSWPQIINQHLCVAEIFGTEVTASLQLSWLLSDTSGRKQEVFNNTFMSLLQYHIEASTRLSTKSGLKGDMIYISLICIIYGVFNILCLTIPTCSKEKTAVTIIVSAIFPQQDPSYRAEDADPDEPVIEVKGGLAWRDDWWIPVDATEIWQNMQRDGAVEPTWNLGCIYIYMFIEIFSTSTVLSLISPWIVDIHQSILVW